MDLTFLRQLDLGDELDSLLLFLGVSLDSNYIFADKRIYNSLRDGLDYIPALYKGGETVEKLYGEELLQNVSVINVKGKAFHPALINDNNYLFLENISGRSIRSELDILRVKNYDSFPKQYMDILFEKLFDLPSGVERLYLSLFYPLHKLLNKYLDTTKGNLEWVSKQEEFYLAQNRQEYEVLKKNDIRLLMFYNGNEIPAEIVSKKVSLMESEIVADGLVVITSEVLELLNSKMCYLLAAISNTTFSELNFKDNSNRIKEIQDLLNGCQVFVCKKLSRKIICPEAGLEFENNAEVLFDRGAKKLYLIENCSKKMQAELFANYLFKNSSIISEVELILYFKELPDLEADFEIEDINLFKKLWIRDYDKKFMDFQNELLNGFINDLSCLPANWYIYNKKYKSGIILNLYTGGRINELEKRLQKVKLGYDNLFNDFQIVIDFTLNDVKISEMITFLEQLNEADAQIPILELKEISKSIGKEERIDAIEKEITERFKYGIFQNTDHDGIDSTKKELDFERRIEGIFNKLPSINDLKTTIFSAVGKPVATDVNINRKKLIFQGENSTSDDGKYLEETGAKGEEQVLGYYINQFISLPLYKRVTAIEALYKVIRLKLGNESHAIFKDECLKHITDDVSLKKALIPFLYIALHHKFSYFDIIAFKNDAPVIIEVKTTQSNNNDSFYISIAEVNEATIEPNYEIVRVTPSEIIFMGNPIKEFSDKITSINGDNYKLVPRNYKFEFSKKKENVE